MSKNRKLRIHLAYMMLGASVFGSLALILFVMLYLPLRFAELVIAAHGGIPWWPQFVLPMIPIGGFYVLWRWQLRPALIAR